jgi:hypothetical protein
MSTADKISVQVQLSVAGDASKTWYWAPATGSGTWKLKGARFTPSSAGAVTANDTNYMDLSVKKSSTVVAHRDSLVASGALVAGTPVDLPITGTGKDLEFSPTAPCVVLADGTPGSGQAVDGILDLQFEQVGR